MIRVRLPALRDHSISRRKKSGRRLGEPVVESIYNTECSVRNAECVVMRQCVRVRIAAKFGTVDGERERENI